MKVVYATDKVENLCEDLRVAKKFFDGNILEPLDENEQSYNPCKIDEIAENVRIVEITEVSKHYE